jgi:hypothetical protein
MVIGLAAAPRPRNNSAGKAPRRGKGKGRLGCQHGGRLGLIRELKKGPGPFSLRQAEFNMSLRCPLISISVRLLCAYAVPFESRTYGEDGCDFGRVHRGHQPPQLIDSGGPPSSGDESPVPRSRYPSTLRDTDDELPLSSDMDGGSTPSINTQSTQRSKMTTLLGFSLDSRRLPKLQGANPLPLSDLCAQSLVRTTSCC